MRFSRLPGGRPWRNSVRWLLPFVVLVGIQFGAGLYEKIVVVPQWAPVPGGEVVAAIAETGMYAAGRDFWPFISPAVGLLAVANLVAAWRSANANRAWWFGGAACMVAYAVFSYSFFVPQMLLLQSEGASWAPARVESLVGWWTGLNYLRMAMGAAGWLCALRALSLAGRPAATADAVHRSLRRADGREAPRS